MVKSAYLYEALKTIYILHLIQRIVDKIHDSHKINSFLKLFKYIINPDNDSLYPVELRDRINNLETGFVKGFDTVFHFDSEEIKEKKLLTYKFIVDIFLLLICIHLI